VVVAALLYAVVSGGRSLLGGNDKAASADPKSGATTSTTSVDASADSVAPGAPTSTTLPGTPTSSTVADAGRTPTATDPARVYIAGDSDAGGFAPFLQPILDKTKVATITLDYKVSTGLARPDFFDWPAHLAQAIPAANPDIVIITFGGNDGQPITGIKSQSTGLPAAVGSPEWNAEYAKRVGALMDFLTAGGRTLIWVGIPNGPTDDFTSRLKAQNTVVLDQVTKHPGVKFVDAWNIFTGLDGGYAQWVTDPADGTSKPVRQSDGFHLNKAGEQILSSAIAAAVVDDLRARGAKI